MSPEVSMAKPAPVSLDPPPHSVRRAWWRKAMAAGLYGSGALRLAIHASKRWRINPPEIWPFERTAQPKFAVLCYHRVGTKGLPLFSALPPEVFEAQMRYLRGRYRIISVAQLCDELRKPQEPEPSVAITFDDGYVDLWHNAFPILQKYRIPATIFLPVGAIETGKVPWYDRLFAVLQMVPGPSLELELDTQRRFSLDSPTQRLQVANQIIFILRSLPDTRRQQCCAELDRCVSLPEEAIAGRMLSWNQIRAMADQGISFGSHSISHRVMSQLEPAEVRHELLESKKVIEERIGCLVDTFAFPFGKPADIGAITDSALASCGYRCAMTTTEGINEPGSNPYHFHRTQIGEERSLPMFAYKLHELFLRGARADHAAGLPDNALKEKNHSTAGITHA